MNGGNCVTSMFNAVVPSLEEYLHLDDAIVSLEDGEDKVSLGYTYDYSGNCKRYIPEEDINIDIQDGSLFYDLVRR